MKKLHSILLITIMICLVIPIKGQTLHTIIFANTNDPQIGKSVVYDYNSLSVEVNTIACSHWYETKKVFLQRRVLQQQKFKKCIESIKYQQR